MKWLPMIVLGNLMLWYSCANQGMGPEGGPRDSIPPVILHSIPKPFQTNFTGTQIDLDFNEFVVPEKLNEKLVVSPPLAQKPTIKTKGRSVLIKINEDLIPERTYSIDFKDGIKDFREGNPMENFRMIFSTYDKLDTLRIGGILLDAFTLAPVENALMSLYSVESDSAFLALRPDFIAKTDKEGRFLFDNLASEPYRLFALNDEDNNLYFSKKTESIAFVDSLFLPSASFIAKTDTVITEQDTTIVESGFTKFMPEEILCLQFKEDHFNQYLSSFKRTTHEKMQFIFTEGVTDSFRISLIDADSVNNWNYKEYSFKRDTVDVWITDTALVAKDTLLVGLDYTIADSSGQFMIQSDTLKMIFVSGVSKKAKTTVPLEDMVVAPFSFSTNLKSNEFDLNHNIEIVAPDPTDTLQKEFVILESFVNDSTLVPETFTLAPEYGSKRKYLLTYQPKEMTSYRLSIDSGMVHTFRGVPNAFFQTKFTTQKAEYYGTILLSMEGFTGKGILLVLRNSEKEELVRRIEVPDGTKEIVIDYLKPEKYRLKLIDDANGDGDWTTGRLLEKIQPERVYYFPKVIKIKSNWEQKETWTIEPEIITVKKIEDDEQDKVDQQNKTK